MKSSVFNNPIVRTVLRALSLLGLKLSGWTVIPPPKLDPPYVVIGAPHTSNWDFLLMLAGTFYTRQDMKWMGKHTLFPPVLGILMKWLGGIPVNRSQGHNIVKQMIRAFDENPSLILIIAPEGTRKRVSTWKRGFYQIAYQAKVPIMITVIDSEQKMIRFAAIMQPSGDYSRDLALIMQHYEGIKEIGIDTEYH